MHTLLMSETTTTRKAKSGPYFDAGQYIKRRRTELGINQNELALRYGSSQGYISSIERGWENILNASAVFYERMAEALEMDNAELMMALGVEFAVARNLEQRQASLSAKSETGQGEYVTVVIKVKNKDPLTAAQERVITLPAAMAAQGQVHGYRYQIPTVEVIPTGVDVVYLQAEARPDDLVVFELQLPEGGTETHVGYYNAPDSVELDQPISKLLPLVVRPSRILGVVKSFVSSDQPRRRPLN